MKADKNLARYLSVNVVRLAKEVLADFPRSAADLDRLISRLHAEARGDHLTQAEKRALLFGQASLDDLPLAVLDARYLPLTDERVPQSADELAALCRWLISRSGGDTALCDTLVRGWAGGATPHDAFGEFVDRMWATRQHHRDFFEAVVTGRHHKALTAITNGEVVSLGDERAIWLLTRMALIWAGFDCQATTARVRRSMTRPLGWLIRGEGQRIKAATLLAVLRPIGTLTGKLLAAYKTTWDERSTPEFRSRQTDVIDIRKRAGAIAGDLERREGKFALDDIVCAVRERWGSTADALARQAQQSQTDATLGRQQACQLWYAGLSPLEAVGLVAMRLAQMEQHLEDQIRGAIEDGRRRQCAPFLSMPDFYADDLHDGWKGRTRAIVDALRSAILKDPDLHTRRRSRVQRTGISEMLEGAANDDPFIVAVTEFLAHTKRYGRVWENDSWRERRAVFDTLDLAINKRVSSAQVFHLHQMKS
ncbi:hypothetical protein [Sphingomonas phyllosphaerae]|uniref:hypothetical protein n=1 Tax=Sphingomonas phyllosphaerae TaxID=257003 RepID=UPI0004125027|nr:hypothetical protein [Sphingomonas phyllosphaerae]